MKIIFIRHGETAKNIGDKLHSISDTENLTNTGVEQIKKTAESLKKYLPFKIYSSKETRAIQSSEILAKDLGIKFEIVDDLQERNWGEFSGKSWSDVQAVIEPMSLEDRYTYTPIDGESWKDFEERLIRVIDNLIKINKDQNLVFVTHGGALRALTPFLLSAPKEESFKYIFNNASVTIFNKVGDVLSLEKLNDTSHLI